MAILLAATLPAAAQQAGRAVEPAVGAAESGRADADIFLAAGESNPFVNPSILRSGVTADDLRRGVGRLPKLQTLGELVEAPPAPPSASLAASAPPQQDAALAGRGSASNAIAASPSSSSGLAATGNAAAPMGERAASVGKAARKLAAKYDVSRIGNRDIGSGLNFYSIEKEMALGRELSATIEAQVRLIEDPAVTEYVNRIGQNLVRNSDARVPFIIKVVDDEELNAFALPGGFFYVNSGLILAAENEAELAGVMAHEIAHVAARHATKNATKSDLWNLASIPLVFIGGPAGMAIRQIADLALPMTFLKFGRNAERDADVLGIQYAFASGYDPAAFITFFEKVQSTEKDKPNFVARAFSTHPMNDDRVRRSQKVLDEYLPPRDEYVVTTSEFDEIKGRLARFLGRRQVDAGQGAAPTLRRRVEDAPVK